MFFFLNFLAPSNRPIIVKKWRFLAILAILGPILAPIGRFLWENQPNRPETFFLGLLWHLFDKKILCFFFLNFLAPSNRPIIVKKWRFLAILAILGPILAPIGRFLWENQPNRPETFFLGLLWHLFDKKILCFFF